MKAIAILTLIEHTKNKNDKECVDTKPFRAYCITLSTTKKSQK